MHRTLTLYPSSADTTITLMGWKSLKLTTNCRYLSQTLTTAAMIAFLSLWLSYMASLEASKTLGYMLVANSLSWPCDVMIVVWRRLDHVKTKERPFDAVAEYGSMLWLRLYVASPLTKESNLHSSKSLCRGSRNSATTYPSEYDVRSLGDVAVVKKGEPLEVICVGSAKTS